MSEFIKDIDKDLGTIISKKMHMQPVLAEKWSWKILNEYPEDLKNVIRKWAKDEQNFFRDGYGRNRIGYFRSSGFTVYNF